MRPSLRDGFLRGVIIIYIFNSLPAQEDYIVKSVDLLSGLGGAMGLWLGWSVLSLGNSIVKAFRTFTSVKLFK